MARARSMSTRWTIRFALAIFVVVSVVSWFLYSQARERISRDAALMLRLQANELIGQLQRSPDDVGAIEAYIDQHAGLGYRVLALGFRILDADGQVTVERGSFLRYPISLPAELPIEGSEPLVEELDAGLDYPFFVMTVAAPVGWVQAAVNTQLFERSAREIRYLFLLSIPVVLAITGAFGYVLARSSLRPVERMIETAERVSATHLHERVPLTGTGDELDRLAQSLNAMTDRIASGVGRMRRFSAEAAHELRTPVSLMRNRLESALAGERDTQADQELIEATLGDVDRLSATIRAMLRLAHSEAGLDPERVQAVDLLPLLDGVVDFFLPIAEEREVVLKREGEATARIVGDPTWLHQLFANLVDNAIKFTRAGGRVTISIASEGDRVRVDVRDSGVGIPAEEHERVFESFHRVNSPLSGVGSGLGLPLAREIARAHGGDVSLESEEGKGSVFHVNLPSAAAAQTTARWPRADRNATKA